MCNDLKTTIFSIFGEIHKAILSVHAQIPVNVNKWRTVFPTTDKQLNGYISLSKVVIISKNLAVHRNCYTWLDIDFVFLCGGFMFFFMHTHLHLTLDDWLI